MRNNLLIATLILPGVAASGVSIAAAQETPTVISDEYAQPIAGTALSALELSEDLGDCRDTTRAQSFLFGTNRNCVFGDVSVNGFTYDDVSSEDNLDESSRRLLAGYATSLGANFYVGGALSYEILESEMAFLSEYDGGDRWSIGAVAGGTVAGVEAAIGLGYVTGDAAIRRFEAGVAGNVLETELGTSATMFSVEAAYPWRLERLDLRPSFSVTVISAEFDAFSESVVQTGAEFARSQGGDAVVSVLTPKVEASRTFEGGDQWDVTPYAALGAAIPLGDDLEMPVRLAATDDMTAPDSLAAYAPLGGGHARLTLGGVIELENGVGIDFGYDGRFGGDLFYNRLSVHVRRLF